MKVRAALIVDGNEIKSWQRAALEGAADLLDVQLVLSCTNTRIKRRLWRNFLYYILNFFSLRNSLTRRVSGYFSDVRVLGFESDYDGAWQVIPATVVDELRRLDIDVVVKFGMSLLRIDGPLAGVDILSFHHGDPESYRGRPAGFYELYQNADRVGIIVQRISNKLDAGDVYARGYSKICYHSYKKTAENFYHNSRFLLRKAIINYQNKTPVILNNLGPNYRLPSNWLVLKFLFRIFFRKLMRLSYGAFVEKKWGVVVYENMVFDTDLKLNVKDGVCAPIPASYVFYADPFFGGQGSCIRVEALDKRTGLGDIVQLDAKTLELERVLLKGKHYSYPFSFVDDGNSYIIPEAAGHSSPFYLKESCGEGGVNFEVSKLQGLESESLVDGTLFNRDGVYYFFCGYSNQAANTLQLFTSRKIDGPYAKHPACPIVIDPKSARMAGRIIENDGKIYRLGQNNCRGYGDGITVSEIVLLSESSYKEVSIGEVRFEDACGPHTLDIYDGNMVLDFYKEKFSLLAGYRRLIAKL